MQETVKDKPNTVMSPRLVSPYGGDLVNLLALPDEIEELKSRASELPSVQVSDRVVCDLELLAVGGFSPLRGFMGKADYERVVEEMRLADGTLFPIPVVLPVAKDVPIQLDREISLRNSKNELLAVMRVEEVYEWDRDHMAARVLGTTDERHPLIAEMSEWGPINLAGRLKVIQLPTRYDFADLRLTPAQTRERLEQAGRASPPPKPANASSRPDAPT